MLGVALNEWSHFRSEEGVRLLPIAIISSKNIRLANVVVQKNDPLRYGADAVSQKLQKDNLAW